MTPPLPLNDDIICGWSPRFDINNEDDKKRFYDINKLFEFLGGTKVFIAFGLPYSWKEYNTYYKSAIKLIKSTYGMIQVRIS